jgi:hypothetical protein
MIQTHFLDDWTDIAQSDPIAFVREVEKRYPNMPKEVRLFISLVKNGEKAGKAFSNKRYASLNVIKMGDWIVDPYSNYLINVLRNVVKHKLEAKR